LVQIRSSNDQSPLQARIATFLADRAQKLDSHLLAMISQRVSADPFTKVKKLVKDLIWKLTEEATAETEHKGWCDTELSTNKQTRDDKTENVGKLTAEAEQLTSEIAQLAQDMEDLTGAIAELSSAMATATADRAESKATNEATIKDAKEAQVAIENAIAILKEYYAKSAKATSLVQQAGRATAGGKRRQTPADDAPETFDAPYKGMLPEGGSVADFLEVILTDFARLESETTTAEATEAEEHKKYMFASEKDKALKENEKGHKESKKSDKESTLHATEEELKATQEQLDAAIAYYEKLKPTCVDSGITYEERVKRREEEIQSLKEALQILSGTAIDLP
jgi:outer membrane murein-binding lipoprotein Lpp